MLTDWEVTKTSVCIFCQLSNLTISAWPQAFSLPVPTSAIVLGNGHTGGRMEKNMSDWELSIFPTTQHSSGTITAVGVFPPTARDRPGVKVADWQGGKVAGGYITLSSVCVMMLKGCLPLLLTRIIIANEWNSAAHIKRREPYHNARSHVGPLFWCLLHTKGFSKPDTCWLLL